MLNFSSFLIELKLKKNTWEYVITSKDKKYVGNNLVDLVQTAYRATPDGSFVNALKDVLPSDWVVIDLDDNPDIDATIFYRKARSGEKWTGRKVQGIGHDGSQDAKTKVIDRLVKELSTPGTWVEASHALEKVLLKKGVKPVTDVTVLQALFNDPKLKMISDTSYSRSLPDGKLIQETVFGRPRLA
jgi:hypothetical protein